MKQALPPTLLGEVSELIADQLGLEFPPERHADLTRALEAAAPAFGLGKATELGRWLIEAELSRHQIEVLAGFLTVGETYFWREPRVFELLRDELLPPLIKARRASGERRLRLWSAACCTGEEPYSLAILLTELIDDLDDWQVTLLATDINPAFLAAAASGIYRRWSFRNTPEWLRRRYFTPAPAERVEIDPRIRRLVTFSYLNLAEDVYPALLTNTNAMDLILCRNVLMYFGSEQRRQAIARLRQALLPGGWLATGQSEVSDLFAEGFHAFHFPQAILYRRAGGAPVPLPSPPAIISDGQSIEDGIKDAIKDAIKDGIKDGVGDGRSEEIGAEIEAIVPVIEAAEDGAEDGAAEVQRARVCASQGQLDQARAWCERAIALNRMEAGHHYLLAAIEAERGAFGASRDALRRALYLDPEFVLAHFALGNLARREGRAEEVKRHFRNALQLLERCAQDELLPHAEGMTAGRLRVMIEAYREGAETHG